MVRAAAEGRRADRAVSGVPREERRQRIQPAGRGRQPSGAVLHQRLSGGEEVEGARRVDRVSRNDSRPSPADRDRARAEGHPSDRPLHLQQRLRRRVGPLRRAAGRRDEAVLVGPRSARHAVVAGVPRLAAGGRLRHAHHGVDAAAGDRLHARATPPKRSDDIASEIDRYIIWPGQATAYMLGMLEIRKARDEAQAAMGQRFDIKAFHDRVLEDGGVPITFLTGQDPGLGSGPQSPAASRASRCLGESVHADHRARQNLFAGHRHYLSQIPRGPGRIPAASLALVL